MLFNIGSVQFIIQISKIQREPETCTGITYTSVFMMVNINK